MEEITGRWEGKLPAKGNVPLKLVVVPDDAVKAIYVAVLGAAQDYLKQFQDYEGSERRITFKVNRSVNGRWTNYSLVSMKDAPVSINEVMGTVTPSKSYEEKLQEDLELAYKVAVVGLNSLVKADILGNIVSEPSRPSWEDLRATAITVFITIRNERGRS